MSAFFNNSKKVFLAGCLLSLSSFSHAVDAQKSLPERLSNVKAGEHPIYLLGKKAEVGKKAPEFKVVDSNFKATELKHFKGKTILISVVPSIDTGVCSLQTKRFNSEVSNLPENVVLLTISTDLPFAQKRYCQQEGVDKLVMLSDAVWRDFGSNYGLLIKDMGLLTRAVLIIDKEGKLAYLQMVEELANEANYDDALNALKKILAANSNV